MIHQPRVSQVFIFLRDDVTMLRKVLTISSLCLWFLLAGCEHDNSVKTPVPPAPPNHLLSN
jgi:hypothetical protein